MIRFDGYYKTKPSLYQERKEWDPDYSTTAYLFQDNNIVISAQKWTKGENDVDFNMEDFEEENGRYDYTLRNNELCLKEEITPEWESKFYYDRVSDEEFVSRQTGEHIKFVPWK